MNKPGWIEDGNPANLEAAAMDALEWLDFFQSFGAIRGVIDSEKNLKALADCIRELKAQLEQGD